MQFKGKVVWITGASSGIGAALALELSHHGAILVLSARRKEALEQVCDNCRNSDQHMVLPLDLSKPDTFRLAKDQVVERYGFVDILINNGGVSQRSLALDTQLSVDQSLMAINYIGNIGLTKQVAPIMLDRGVGQLVVISSLVGYIGTPMRSSYAASKHALHGFYESLRAELDGRGVSILMVCPGGIKTNVSLNALTSDGAEHGQMDALQETGMSAKQCALEIMAAMHKEQAELLVGGRETWVVYIRRYAPWLYRRLIAKAKVT